jgi:gluconokinase
MIVVVMGVSGCGKTSVGRALAQEFGATFIEGDDLHPVGNKQKMAAGTPLDDADRWPWLDRIVEATREVEGGGRVAVVACSALKRIYRDRLRLAGPDVRFLFLKGSRALIAERMDARRDHFMPPGLLDSQLATLEPPGAEETAYALDVALPVERIVDSAINALQSTSRNASDSRPAT